MDVLSVNFATHEKQIIADHDPLVLTEKVTRQYSEVYRFKARLIVRVRKGVKGKVRKGVKGVKQAHLNSMPASDEDPEYTNGRPATLRS